jgi:hypothetical protein
MARQLRLRPTQPMETLIGAVLVAVGSVGLVVLLASAGLPWEGMAALIVAWVVAFTFGTRS